jgi:hypothetical protein
MSRGEHSVRPGARAASRVRSQAFVLPACTSTAAAMVLTADRLVSTFSKLRNKYDPTVTPLKVLTIVLKAERDVLKYINQVDKRAGAENQQVAADTSPEGGGSAVGKRKRKKQAEPETDSQLAKATKMKKPRAVHSQDDFDGNALKQREMAESAGALP